MLLCDHITKLFMLNLEVKTFVLTDIINETEENKEGIKSKKISQTLEPDKKETK